MQVEGQRPAFAGNPYQIRENGRRPESAGGQRSTESPRVSRTSFRPAPRPDVRGSTATPLARPGRVPSRKVNLVVARRATNPSRVGLPGQALHELRAEGRERQDLGRRIPNWSERLVAGVCDIEDHGRAALCGRSRGGAHHVRGAHESPGESCLREPITQERGRVERSPDEARTFPLGCGSDVAATGCRDPPQGRRCGPSAEGGEAGAGVIQPEVGRREGNKLVPARPGGSDQVDEPRGTALVLGSLALCRMCATPRATSVRNKRTDRAMAANRAAVSIGPVCTAV